MSGPAQINSPSNPRLDPIDSKSSLYFLNLFTKPPSQYLSLFLTQLSTQLNKKLDPRIVISLRQCLQVCDIAACRIGNDI